MVNLFENIEEYNGEKRNEMISLVKTSDIFQDYIKFVQEEFEINSHECIEIYDIDVYSVRVVFSNGEDVINLVLDIEDGEILNDVMNYEHRSSGEIVRIDTYERKGEGIELIRSSEIAQ